MNRRLLVIATLIAAFAYGCGRSEALVMGEGYSTSKSSSLPTPTAHGGGPKAQCHDAPNLELGNPAEVPDGYDEGDDSVSSPAHPLHLKAKKKPGVEDNI